MNLKKFFLSVTAFILFSISSFAGNDKGEGPILVAASPVVGSSYTVTSYESTWNDQVFATDSYHDIRFDSGNALVDNIEMTLFVPLTGSSLLFETAVFTDYDTLTVLEEETATGNWYNISWARSSDDDFDDVLMLSFTLRSFECPTTVNDALPIEFLDYSRPTLSWYNVFNTTTGLGTPATKNDGDRTYAAPVADLTVWQPGMAAPGQVASGCSGCDVTVDLNLRDVSFGYNAYTATITFDPELNYNSFTPNSTFAPSAVVTPGVNQVTISGSGYAFAVAPFEDELFGQLHFTIDSSADSDTNYNVEVASGTFYHSTCSAFTASVPGGEVGYVYAEEEEATWKIDMDSFCINTTGRTLDFYIKTNVPIHTSSDTGIINAAFTIDKSLLGKTTLVGVNSGWINGAQINWRLTEGEYGFHIEEAPGEDSYADIEPSDQFQKVGELVLDVGGSTGVDAYEFFFVAHSSPIYHYVRAATTGKVLSINDQSLSLVDGSATATICSGGGGCLALSTQPKGMFVFEDYVLTGSHGKTVDDYLPLTRLQGKQSDELRIKIEASGKTAQIDQVALIAVDHPQDSWLGISNMGEFFVHRDEIQPLKAVDDFGNDLLTTLAEIDGNLMEAEGPGSMVLTFANPYAGERDYRLAFLQGEVIGGSCQIPNPIPVAAEIEDRNGSWHSLGSLLPRENGNAGARWIWDASQGELGDVFRLRIAWQDGYKVDGHVLLLEDESPLAVNQLKLSSAQHSNMGSVTSSLGDADGTQTGLGANQSMELSFRQPRDPVPEGYVRSYFVKTRGTNK